ncbi:hypothetical protein ABIC35_001234 [Sphingomonas trueperi]
MTAGALEGLALYRKGGGGAMRRDMGFRVSIDDL